MEHSVLGAEHEGEQTRRAETEKAFVDAFLRESPFGILMLDNELRYVALNDALAKINGLPAQDHIGRQLRDVVFPADDGEYEKRVRDVLETGQPIRNLLLSGRTEGRPDQDGAWSASFFRVATREGQVLGLGGMIVDVTEKETALLEASAVRQRLDLLNQASARVGTTLDMAQTASELTEVAVPTFADVAVVEIRENLFDNNEFPPSDVPVRTRRLASLTAMGSPAAGKPFSGESEVVHLPGSRLHESLYTGQAYLAEKVDDAVIVGLAHNEDQARLLRDSGLGSLVVVPLIARGRLLGIAVFGRSTTRAPMTDDDLTLAKELASRAAMCLDNARLYSNERRIAVELQRSMLPEEEDLPRRSGLEIAYHYRPGSRAARIGGDWFDVIQLAGHRMALVIGDVMGHGIHAAANMGQLRTAMRTLARLDLEPVELLTRLDNVVQSDATFQYATCVYAVYDTVTRHCSIARAGHLPPILRHQDGTTEVISMEAGVPLGVAIGGVEFAAADLVLPEDSTLVLYTDGLIERREDDDIDVGINALRTALTVPADSVKELCDGVVAGLRRHSEEDDTAVLMARMPAMPGHRLVTWQVPPDPRSASQARTMVRRTLSDWNLPTLVDTTELLVSELVTNALRYAQGEIELRLAKGGTLVCEVADGDDRMVRQRRPDPEEEQGRGLRLVSELARRWGTRSAGSGKVVWIELPLPADSPSA